MGIEQIYEHKPSIRYTFMCHYPHINDDSFFNQSPIYNRFTVVLHIYAQSYLWKTYETLLSIHFYLIKYRV